MTPCVARCRFGLPAFATQHVAGHVEVPPFGIDTGPTVVAGERDAVGVWHFERRHGVRRVRKERGATELAYDLGKIDDATYNEERAVFKQAEDMVISSFNAQWVATMKREEGANE